VRVERQRARERAGAREGARERERGVGGDGERGGTTGRVDVNT
jgi:hypothetical protein